MILAIDPGRQTGWALYSPASGRADCGTERLTEGDLGADLSNYAAWLAGMIRTHRPTVVAFERPFGRAGFTSDLPGILVAVGHMVACEHQVPRREFTASAVKKGVTGSGKASKREVMDAVRARFGFDPQSDHEGDAAAVAVLAYAREAQDA